MATNIATQVSRIQNAMDRIKAFFFPYGICGETDKIDVFADGLAEKFIDNGAVTKDITEGERYSIPRGWHNGNGYVQGVAGGGNYELETPNIVVPTKSIQTIQPGEGYYGLATVTVDAIPSSYAEVGGVTAAAADVLSSKKFVTSTGVLTSGTMPNNAGNNITLNPLVNENVTIAKGYYNGNGKFSLTADLLNSLTDI